jgi:hypothetical protein
MTGRGNEEDELVKLQTEIAELKRLRNMYILMGSLGFGFMVAFVVHFLKRIIDYNFIF